MVRTGILQFLMPSISRLVIGLWLRYLGSQAPRPQIYLDSCLLPLRLLWSLPLPLVTSQAQLESDVREPQPGVTAGSRRMFQALGGPDRYPAVPFVSHWLVRRGVRAPLVELLG